MTTGPSRGTGTISRISTVRIEEPRGWIHYPGEPGDIPPTGAGPGDGTPPADQIGQGALLP
jgi:hypothetical protein